MDGTKAAYPDLRGQHFHFATATAASILPHPAEVRPACRRSALSGDAAFTVVSYNVCSMKDGREVSGARGCPERAAALHRQMREERILFLGLQETRTPQGSKKADGFLILSSGAANGNFGCDLRVDPTLPYACKDGVELTIPEQS